MTSMRARWLLVAAAACAGVAGFWLAQQLDQRQLDRGSPQLASGTWLPRKKPIGDFQLTDTSGRPFTLRELAAAPSLVFFGFTHCPDVCPTTLIKLRQILQRGAIPGLRVLFISVDPGRDTPAVLSRYLQAFDPQFQGLSGDPVALARIAAQFNVAFNRVELPGGDYTMDHSAVVFLTDRSASIAAIFTPPLEVAAVSGDLGRAAAYLGAGDGRLAP
jgi:protein SCO1/2